MIKNQKFYKEIYFVSNSEDLPEKKFDTLLMCDSKNWDFYFYALDEEDKNKLDFEVIENTRLIEFEGENEMMEFWKALRDSQKIGYSIEHNLPCILKYE